MHKTAKVATLSLLTAAFLSSASYAADVYGKGSTKDAPSSFEDAKVVNWSGFYIQGQAGYGKAQHDLSVQFHDGKGFNEFLGLDGLGGDGFIGGGRVGYDIARGRFLFGVFGEYNWSNLETELSIAGVPTGATFSLEKDNEWSVGARAGVIVAPRTLAYILAAYTQSDYSINGPGVTAFPGFNPEKTLDGVTVGAGVEYALMGNVFLGLEGTYTAYDTEEWLHTCGNAPCGGGDARLEVDTDELKVLGTLKIKLNAGLPGLSD